MKKFIRAVVLFTLFTACLYVPLLFLWGDAVPYWVYTNLKYKRGHDSTLFMLNEARHIENPDVLILGSSHAYRGFDVRIFNKAGYKVFNMGSSSQTPLQTYILLQRYLKTIRPRCVVYEVFPETFTNMGIEGATNLMSNDRNDSLSYDMAIEINNLITYNTLAYGYYHDFTRSENANPEINLPAVDVYVPGGYVEKEVTYFNNRPANKKTDVIFNKSQRNAFEKSIALLKKNHIKYILVFAPLPKSKYNSYKNKSEIALYFKQQGLYYDYNTKVSLNDSLHFFDDNHLNQRGVELFNHQLLKNKAIFNHAIK